MMDVAGFNGGHKSKRLGDVFLRCDAGFAAPGLILGICQLTTKKLTVSQNKSASFQPRLEALRGIAALMVAYAHSIGAVSILSPESAFLKKLFATLGNGGVGVTIFFVLSGHVLSLSLGRSGAASFRLWFDFVVRRFLRIFPAMFVCLLFCYLWVSYVHHPQRFDAASNDYYLYWSGPVSLLDLAKDLAFITNRLNPVTWTLQVEMLAGLVFVPLWLVCRKSYPLAFVVLIAWMLYFLMAPLYSFARTGFIFMFILGVLVKPGSVWAQKYLQPNVLATIAVGAFVLCCLVNKIIPETVAGAWVIEALLAYVLITTLGSGNGGNRLSVIDHAFPRFLGSISYSFYLWHFPVLFILGTYLFSVIPNAAILAWPNLFQNMLFLISAALTVPVAWASYLCVEKPLLNKIRRPAASYFGEARSVPGC